MQRVLLAILLFLFSLPAWADRSLDVYFIDVEGGQATLFVSPSGETMLVDAGWPDANGRDADRIAEVAKLAGVSRIDYLVITHYHMDHVGGVPQLAERLPIGTFVDHGHSVETGKEATELFRAYVQVRQRGSHLIVRAGDRIPIEGMNVEVLTSAGREISKPLPGAGEPNALCSDAKRREADPSENAQSIGMLITYGTFRLIDLGDLTWNKELELACPVNKIGAVDVYLGTHHGMNLSGPPAIVHALQPVVAIMNNGAKKGGSPEAWQTIRSSPGLRDIWQLHYAVEAGKQNNAPDAFIANLTEKPHANWILLAAHADGRFTVTNSRNGETQTYASHE